MTVTGHVYDDLDGPADLRAWWHSSLDGDLGVAMAPAPDGSVAGEWTLAAGDHDVTLWVQDLGGALGSDVVRISIRANTPPTLEVLAPSGGDVQFFGAPVNFLGQVGDADQDPSTLALTWSTDLDGVISTRPPEPSGYVAFTHEGLSSGTHLLTVTVTDAGGLTARDRRFLFVDQLPTAPGIAIEPPSPGDHDELEAVVVVPGSDPDGDPITYTWAWTVDTAPGPTTPHVPADLTFTGQTWEVRVTPWDPFGPGPAGVATVTIGARPPEVLEVEIGPADPRTNDVLVAKVTAADPDGDELDLSYTWYVDGLAVPATTDSLDGATWFDKHQEVWVEVVADDGDQVSSPRPSDPVVVRNTPPTPPEVHIHPEHPRPVDDLWCEITIRSFDDDGDPVRQAFTWEVDGEAFLGAETTIEEGDTIRADDHSCGETWTCTVTPNDGEAPGEPGSDLRSLEASEMIGFGDPRILVGPSPIYVDAVHAADLDDDGDHDVVWCAQWGRHSEGDQVAWSANLGDGTFAPTRNLSFAVEGPCGVHAGDLDADGDVDVVSASAWDHKIAWYENLGEGRFGEQRAITTAAGDVRKGLAIDLDGDGDLDVLSASGQPDYAVAWYENLGDAAFGPQRVIGTGTRVVYPVDLDGDLDPDVLTAVEHTDVLVWFENLGGGVFGPDRAVATVDAPSDVYAGDLDDDGDSDAISVSAGGTVGWYENSGGGAFGPLRLIAETAEGGRVISASDLDGDGDTDVLSASSRDPNRGVLWYENLGAGIFGAEQFVGAGTREVVELVVSDLDGDADPDVLTADNPGSIVAWYENLNGGIFGPSRRVQACAYAAESVLATDLDGDDDVDVLSASAAELGFGDPVISWSENLGGGTFGPARIVTDALYEVHALDSSDLDGDGDPDVLAASSIDGAVWYENAGDGVFGPRQVVGGVGEGTRVVHAADLDGDGDADVLAGSTGSTGISWFENLGPGGFGLAQVFFAGPVPEEVSVDASDLDLDGDIDVLWTAWNRIEWNENLGGGLFADARIVQVAGASPRSAFATDLDADGDPDLVSAFAGDATVAWFRNLGGGRFGPMRVLDATAPWVIDLFAVDLDQDGDRDILSASGFTNTVAWYENLGDGSFRDEQLVTELAADVQEVFAADLDDDGYADVLSADLSTMQVAWYPTIAVCFP